MSEPEIGPCEVIDTSKAALFMRQPLAPCGALGSLRRMDPYVMRMCEHHWQLWQTHEGQSA